MRLIGPNCLGRQPDHRSGATFSTVLEACVRTPAASRRDPERRVRLSAYAMAILRGLGLSRIVATGNEADVDVAACIDYLAVDPETQVICAASKPAATATHCARVAKGRRPRKPVVT